MAAAAKAAARAARRAMFVQPVDSPDHVWNHSAYGDWDRGILWIDGSIHTWPGGGITHEEYAADLDRTVVAFQGKADESDGFGFYVANGSGVTQYKVPDEFIDDLRSVVAASVDQCGDFKVPTDDHYVVDFEADEADLTMPDTEPTARCKDCGMDLLSWEEKLGLCCFCETKVVKTTELWKYPGWSIFEFSDGTYSAACDWAGSPALEGFLQCIGWIKAKEKDAAKLRKRTEEFAAGVKGSMSR